MNNKVAAVILLILAVVAVWWGWGKLKPYMNTGGGETEQVTPPAALPQQK